MKNKSMTILIPTYNLYEIVNDTLNSVLLSDFNNNCEVIIIDDCSTDNTPVAIRNFIDSHNLDWKLIINKKNLGGGFTKDNSIKYVNTDWFFILDGDDIMEKNFVSQILNRINKDGENLDVIRVKYRSTAPGNIDKITWNGGNNSLKNDWFFSMQISTYVIRKKFWIDKKIKWKFPKYDDYALNLDIYMALDPKRYLKDCEIYSMKWRVYENSVSNSKGGDFMLYKERSLDYIMKAFEKTQDPKIAYMYLDVAASHYYNSLENKDRWNIESKEIRNIISKLMKNKKIRKASNRISKITGRIRFFFFRNNLYFFIKPF